MKYPVLMTLAILFTAALLLLIGCYPATALDTDANSDTDSDSDSDPDAGQDTDTETDTATDSDCDDFCLDDYGEEIPGCLDFCGGIGMVVCESNDLECVYSPDMNPDEGGVCIPYVQLDCYDDKDCVCMPPFENACYGYGAVWTCPTTQCVPECAE